MVFMLKICTKICQKHAFYRIPNAVIVSAVGPAGRPCGTTLSCREISCTPSISLRQKQNRDSKVNKHIQAFENFVLSMLSRSPFLRDFYLHMSKGFRRQASDIKTWWRVSSKLRFDPGYQTTYQEHMAVFDAKGSLLKSSVLLPLFMLPFGFVIIFIPVTLFPQFMLPRCYWSNDQRRKYFTTMNENRSVQHKIILHHLEYLRKSHRDEDFRKVLGPIAKALDESRIPQNRDLLLLRKCCRIANDPLNVSRLPPLLLSSLSHVNFLWKYLPPPWLAYQLNRRAILILQLDEKLRREGLVNHLPENELQDATFMRGLDCASFSEEANRYWLKNWVAHTRDCSASDASYILHAMILLSRNYTEIKFQRKVFDSM